MSDPTRSNRTIYIGGLPQSITEDSLVSTFSTFGDIVDVQLPRHGAGGGGGEGGGGARPLLEAPGGGGGGHRGFGFLVFSTDQEAQDAIDNMHLNELGGVSTAAVRRTPTGILSLSHSAEVAILTLVTLCALFFDSLSASSMSTRPNRSRRPRRGATSPFGRTRSGSRSTPSLSVVEWRMNLCRKAREREREGESNSDERKRRTDQTRQGKAVTGHR